MPIHACAPADKPTIKPVQLTDLAVVAIGRNEGLRLKRCLESVADRAAVVVYVDSGSTDDSVAIAEHLGALIVILDSTMPFTAARARNAGFRAACAFQPDLQFVQFVDGDCVVAPDWLDKSRDFLCEHEEVAIVAGQRREKYPRASIYNELIDAEWRKAAGPGKYCGGDFMVRTKAFLAVGGFKDSMIAGEEPELCVRIRRAGGAVHIVESEMTMHDAALTHWQQWWNRMVRSGHAYIEGYTLHGGHPEHMWRKQMFSAWFWVFGPTTAAAMLYSIFAEPGLLVLLIYPLQIVRSVVREEGNIQKRLITSVSYLLAKLPELVGQITFLKTRIQHRNPTLIEYK